jgi:hypothetical protein
MRLFTSDALVHDEYGVVDIERTKKKKCFITNRKPHCTFKT